MMDWGEGNYARIAQGLLPGSKVAVEVADPRPGERVLDLGCGTGNAALLAAERGAIVTGVDPSQRLLDVAHERAKAANVDVSFRAGKAEATGLTDACADIVMSVFGVIFVAELPDKTALAALLLATRYKPMPVFIGAALALTPINLITLLIGTQVLQGIVTPVILAYILILTNRRSLLGKAANGPLFRTAATVCTVAISAMSLLLLGSTVLGFFGIG